jgi:septal ring factor EnvC (AmiA/AmiB activator)
MKLRPLSALSLACLLLIPGSLSAQDAASLAAVRQAEERYKQLSEDLQTLIAMQAKQQEQINTLTRELNTLKEKSGRPTGNYASQSDLEKLADAVKELDRKREADKKLFLDALEKLEKNVNTRVTTPAPTPARPETQQRISKGYSHIVKDGQYLGHILEAYNEEFKKQGKKPITLKDILDNNPGLEPRSMRIGQEVIIPLPRD